MAEVIDLTGQRFGRWKVLRRSENAPHGMTKWTCECDCGTIRDVLGVNLRYGRTVSCGCYNSEKAADHCRDMAKHGMHNSRIYRIWNTMKNRCQLKTAYNYPNYGGRGIKVCDEWQRFEPFYEWAMANGYRDDLTLDRIDVNGNYEPSNCRWATWAEQAKNRRKYPVRKYALNGKSLKQITDENGLRYETVANRIRRGMTIEDALKGGKAV